MKINHFSFFAAILIASTFAISSSCKKKKKFCESGSTCHSVLEAKDFFLFKQGTWWVYEEQTTHQCDSQFVYEYSNSSGFNFDIRIHSTLEDYNYHYWPNYASLSVSCSETEPVSGQCIYIKRNKGKVGDYIGEGNCFFVNYKKGDFDYVSNMYFLNNKIIVDELNFDLDVGSETFHNVVKIKELNTLIEGKQPTNHYYVKHIGLIRKELIDSNQVWNLVNYHIEQ